MEAPSFTLTCAQCKRRKVRCNKENPCGPCQVAGLSCIPVQRPRRPRGKGASVNDKDAALKARVTRLEALVSDLQSSVVSTVFANDSVEPHTSGMNKSPSLSHEVAPNYESRSPLPDAATSAAFCSNKSNIASSFWEALSAEVCSYGELIFQPCCRSIRSGLADLSD